ncbi:MAG: PorT family protein [Saprospiraceae bacterium]|nr:PorT family protein [Saprospiraceae bacterium]
MKRGIILPILGFLITTAFIRAQDTRRFFGNAKAGLNFAQIDGDNLGGYNRFGYNAGVAVSARLQKNTEIQLEILYSLRGSRYGKYDNLISGYRLDYIDLPLIFCLKDWLKEDSKGSYYKTHFQGGLYVGQLIKSSSLESNQLDQLFRKTDFGWLLGFTFYANRNYGITGRFTRSFLPLHEYIDNGGSKIRMTSYFISLGLTYRFN